MPKFNFGNIDFSPYILNKEELKKLNLQNPEKSEIKYEIIQFPDGEKQLNILDPLINIKESVLILTRITNAEDWFILLQAYNILDRYNVSYNTSITYLMTQRNDRLFSYGRATSMDIIVGSLKGKKIEVIEAHNIEAIKKINPIINDCGYGRLLDYNGDDKIIMFPDKGAKERHKYLVANGDKYLIGEKVRNPDTGVIESYTYKPNSEWTLRELTDSVKKITIVDDLCDGGGTFLLALEQLKPAFPAAEIDLDVVHAVQEKGLHRVCEIFDHVTVTNSYRDWDKLGIENLTVNSVI